MSNTLTAEELLNLYRAEILRRLELGKAAEAPEIAVGQEFSGPAFCARISKLLIGMDGIEEVTASIAPKESPDIISQRCFSMKAWKFFIAAHPAEPRAKTPEQKWTELLLGPAGEWLIRTGEPERAPRDGEWFLTKEMTANVRLAIGTYPIFWVREILRPATAEEIAAHQRKETPPYCGKGTKYHLIAGVSSFACALPSGHEGECKPGGDCGIHGPYVCDGIPQCPKWPECLESPTAEPRKEATTAPVTGTTAKGASGEEAGTPLASPQSSDQDFTNSFVADLQAEIVRLREGWLAEERTRDQERAAVKRQGGIFQRINGELELLLLVRTAEIMHFIGLACPECAEGKSTALRFGERWHDGCDPHESSGRPNEANAHRCRAWRIWQEYEVRERIARIEAKAEQMKLGGGQ